MLFAALLQPVERRFGLPILLMAYPSLPASGLKPTIGHAISRAVAGVATDLRPGTGHGGHAPDPGVGL